ncbi:hypothetical protein D3C80_1418480 [compost metagenome]
MAAGADKGAPVLFVHGNAAADHLVDVAYGKGHMIQAAWTIRQFQQEQVVMAAACLSSQEYCAVDITIRHLEPQHFTVEALGRRQILDEEHHVADIDRLRLGIHRAGLIDAAHVAPLVDRRYRQINFPLPANAKAHRHTVRIKALKFFPDQAETRHLRQQWLQRRQFGRAANAPGHAAQGRTALKCRG